MIIFVILTQPTQDDNDTGGEDDMEKNLTKKLLDNNNNNIGSVDSVGDNCTNLTSVTSKSSSGENVECPKEENNSQGLMKVQLLLTQLTQENNDASGEDVVEKAIHYYKLVVLLRQLFRMYFQLLVHLSIMKSLPNLTIFQLLHHWIISHQILSVLVLVMTRVLTVIITTII